jgi:homopolymeric O-antigen transport system permease protein
VAGIREQVERLTSLDRAERPPRFAAEIWQYRELVRALVVRNLKMRYQRSFLGFAWALLNPLLTVIVLLLVFGTILRVQVDAYWAFLISGYFAWVFVVHTLSTSVTQVTSHSYMARSLAFPSEVLVVSGVLSRLVEFAAEMVLVVVALVLMRHHGVPPAFLLLPVVILIQVLLTTGLALPLAAMGVFFEDVQHALPVGLTLLSFLTPVYYPASYVPESFRAVWSLNPFVGLLELYHGVLYEGSVPSAGAFIGSTVAALVFFAAGLALYRWKRASFAEVV